MQKKSKKSLIYVIIACACVTCAGLFAFSFSPFYLREKVIPVLDGDGMEREGTWLINLEVNSKQAGDFISPGDINFGWQMYSTENGKYQTAYEINVADSEEKLMKNELVWTSGKVESDASAYIAYEGPKLEPVTTYYWEVSVWDEKEELVETKEASFITTVDDSSWKDARWISAPKQIEVVNDYHQFQVDFDFQTESTADFICNASDGEYGSHLLWELDAYGDNLIYRLVRVDHKKQYNVWEEQLHIASSECSEQMMHASIAVVDGKLQTFLNDNAIGEAIDVRNALEFDEVILGTYGFYNGRTEDDSYFDNLKVVANASQTIICDEKFEDERNTIFAPLVLTTEDGRLKVRHQYLLTDIVPTPAPILERVFSVKEGLENAYFFGSSVGIYEAMLNGAKVGNRYYTAGRQSYEQVVKYDAYDITDRMQVGDNVMDIWLGHGWYDRTGSHRRGNLGFCGQIILQYEDGSKEVIGSDSSWHCYMDGPIRNDDMYNGEFYDARKEFSMDIESACKRVENGYSKTDRNEKDGIERTDSAKNICSAYSDENAGWSSAKEIAIPSEIFKLPFVLNEMEPMREIDSFHPIAVEEPRPGVFVYDFGKEITGFVAFDGLKGITGDVITIQYGESIWTENEIDASTDHDSDCLVGTINDNSYLLAQCTNYYICGKQEGKYSPKFSDTAFRYVQVEGLKEALTLVQINAVVVSSDLPITGDFTSSNMQLNQLYKNIFRSQQNNALDIPTDCPQRDERFGWAGDAQTFARSASYNADTYHFIDNYLDYMREGQKEDGAYPDIVQYDMSGYGENGWGDAGVTMTWYHYLQYGDKKIIEDNFDAMCADAEYLVETSDEFVRSTGGYGDHDSVVSTPEPLMSTAQSAYVCQILSKMAGVIGKEDEKSHFLEYYHNFRAAFRANFMAEDGTIECWSQSAYALSLAFDLGAVDEQEELGADLTSNLADNLSNCITYAGNHLNTGYIGTKYLLPVLADSGHVDQAYAILLQNTYPSWFYLMDHGATTIYERWESYLEHEDGTYELQGSLGHVALGSVAEFYYRYILGIEADEAYPGFKHFVLQPNTCDAIESVSGRYESVYGTIESSWEQDAEKITYHFIIPANTSASLEVEGLEKQELLSGEYTFVVQK